MAGYLQKNRTPFRQLMKHLSPRLRPAGWAFWDLALMRANWQDEEEGLKRGQFFFGQVEMAEEIGVSVKTFRNLEQRFADLGELEVITRQRPPKSLKNAPEKRGSQISSKRAVKIYPRGSIGTIRNYSVYVDPEKQDIQERGSQKNGKGATLEKKTKKIQEKKDKLLHAPSILKTELKAGRQDKTFENLEVFSEDEELTAILGPENHRWLRATLQAYGYSWAFKRNRAVCLSFAYEHDAQALEQVFDKVDRRRSIENRAALLHFMFENGLTDDEEYRLETEGVI